MTNEDIFRKIQALLAKGESTKNEHEAAAFMAKAMDLMQKHAIDEATIRAAKPRNAQSVTPIIEEWQFASSDYNKKGKLQILHVIAKKNRCRIIIHPITRAQMPYRHPGANATSQWVWIAGFKDDVEFVKMLYTSILLQAARSMNLEVRKRGLTIRTGSYAFATSYFVGYAMTIEQRLNDLQESIPTDSMALVVRVEEEVNEAVGERFPSLKVARSRNLKSAAGYYQGKTDGHSADIGMTKVGGAAARLGSGR